MSDLPLRIDVTIPEDRRIELFLPKLAGKRVTVYVFPRETASSEPKIAKSNSAEFGDSLAGDMSQS